MKKEKIFNNINRNPDKWLERTMLWLRRREQTNNHDVRCPRCGLRIEKGTFQIHREGGW